MFWLSNKKLCFCYTLLTKVLWNWCTLFHWLVYLYIQIKVNENEDAEENKDAVLPPNVIKMTAFLGSVYGFFLLELVLSKHHSHSHSHDDESGSIVEVSFLDKMKSFLGSMFSSS